MLSCLFRAALFLLCATSIFPGRNGSGDRGPYANAAAAAAGTVDSRPRDVERGAGEVGGARQRTVGYLPEYREIPCSLRPGVGASSSSGHPGAHGSVCGVCDAATGALPASSLETTSRPTDVILFSLEVDPSSGRLVRKERARPRRMFCASGALNVLVGVGGAGRSAALRPVLADRRKRGRLEREIFAFVVGNHRGFAPRPPGSAGDVVDGYP